MFESVFERPIHIVQVNLSSLCHRSLQVPLPPIVWPPPSLSPAVSPQPRHSCHYWAKPRPHCQVRGGQCNETEASLRQASKVKPLLTELLFLFTGSNIKRPLTAQQTLYSFVRKSTCEVHESLSLFSESDLDDCRFPCQGNSPRESLSSQ